MTATSTLDDIGRRISAAMTPAQLRMANQFFGGPVSTRTERDALRAALAAHTDAALVADLRHFLNHAVTVGEDITRATVLGAMNLLR